MTNVTATDPKEILESGGYTLVLANHGEIHTFSGRGISDLYHLLNSQPQLLAGASIADKVVGKGAAALMIAGGVSRVHAAVISEGALALFAASGTELHYTTLTPNIINREGTGICPVEALCANCDTAEECLPQIARFIASRKAAEPQNGNTGTR